MILIVMMMMTIVMMMMIVMMFPVVDKLNSMAKLSSQGFFTINKVFFSTLSFQLSLSLLRIIIILYS